MNILDLEQFSSFRSNIETKVVRHKDMRKDLWELYQTGRFESYQNGQAWDVFGSARYIISFIAERDKFAKFVGAWEVISRRSGRQRGFRYKTRELPGYDDLKLRLIVNWGMGTRSWAQWLHRQGNKEIAEVLPRGYVMEFPGYYNLVLNFDKLSTMVRHSDANRELQRMLSSVSGIYMILDTRSGMQYIGSAYGAGGIWNRWKAYGKNPSGGNKRLKDLLSKYPHRYRHFQFSILRVLEHNATRDEVLAHEALTKRKLGSRVFGLNEN
ncbi:MAG: GIY-YIG nuclease family protein [Planctomycetia bacterium]|jgi:hypothetical protein|nr:GIY-YIG nuclease family protein [Planctomycetia bacterium]MCC7313218.1 GIY-YIG nuclease family protein [Planctomycetota bacterium]OQY96910.1 MAG: hypothetical protein B6D36_19170 [Planctomycetes bacterium UTPLA1]